MRPSVGWLNGFLGSLLAFLAPGAAVVGAALLVSSPGAGHVTAEEWIAACVAAVVTSAAVRAQVAHQVHVDVPKAVEKATAVSSD
jgi:hypothetical protein